MYSIETDSGTSKGDMGFRRIRPVCPMFSERATICAKRTAGVDVERTLSVPRPSAQSDLEAEVLIEDMDIDVG